MILNKNEIIARAKERHSSTGRVVKALYAVLNASWPTGTNLILEYVKQFIGMPYGARNLCMDTVVDCAELWRITFYIWFGMDIGSYSDAQYLNKAGVIVTRDFNELPKCRPLDLVFYKTSSLKRTGHVAAIFDSKRIFHSGASENGKKVNYSSITWGKKYFKSGMYVKRFLTDEQYASIIVGGEQVIGGEEEMIRKGDKGEPVKALQNALIALGYALVRYGADGNFGSETEAAVKALQRDKGLSQSGVVDAKTAGALFVALTALKGKDGEIQALQAKINAAKAALA